MTARKKGVGSCWRTRFRQRMSAVASSDFIAKKLQAGKVKITLLSKVITYRRRTGADLWRMS
jgi:hypothetical protein